ncbi:MAG: M67 family metallopeptidase [Candidatus Omnitrophica bacterium]|nr:M67 family metallopeptidase [Candidatus Omnitrophota bacterium]
MFFLNKDLANEIIAHLKDEVPNEGCGILAGIISDDGKKAIKSFPMKNQDASSQKFFMEPQEQFKVMKTIRNEKLEMVGIYHSHPETDAYPSAHDVELAFYPEVSYLVISFKDENEPAIRSFRIIDGKIEEEKIISE